MSTGAVPKDASLVTVFIAAGNKGVDPGRLYAEARYQVQASFPDATTASAATVMSGQRYVAQVTVWEGAADLFPDGAAHLSLGTNSTLRYDGKGKLYIWLARGRTQVLSNRPDVSVDFSA